MSERSDRWFKTKCGRDVLLSGIHIRPFGHGFLMGRAEVIRERVLSDLPDAAQSIFPGTRGLFIESLAGPTDEYPALIYFCDFLYFSAINPAADCSTLTAVWFGESLDEPIPQFLAPRVAQIDWSACARDGYW